MRIKNWSIPYVVGYFLVLIGVKSYFRKAQFKGKHNIPKNKPILFASNHQSAFLDGAVIGYAIGKPIYFLGRADIFKKKVARFFLNSFNSMPIYREKDGGDTQKKNNEIFQKFYDILSKKHPIVIFPEGNHGKHKQLRPLKKGVFRIGVGAENKYNKELDVHVVPVGIDYEKHGTMGGSLLIQFGEPIRILDYINEDLETQEANYVVLVNELRKRMSGIMIDIQEMEYYDLIHHTVTGFDDEIKKLESSKGKSLLSIFTRHKGFISKIERLIKEDENETKRIKQIESEFSTLLSKTKLKTWLFQKASHSTIGPIFLMILLFPVHLYGVINNYLPYRIPAYFIEKKVKDEHFHASLKLISGALLFVIFWSAQVSLVAVFTDNYIWTLYLLSLLLSAKISYVYWLELLKIKGKLRYNKLRKKDRKVFQKMTSQYTELNNYIAKAYTNE